ncbi:MAG: hypothetical protein KC636_18760 [Myxococcales bacterium]|nr:hypothetical protein [Myxococcales bacterium]
MTTAQDVGTKSLDAYFDAELAASQRDEFEQMLADDPELKAELAELGLLRQAVITSLEAEAAAVPEARFEQIWDEIERTFDRDSRLQQAADAPPSIWSRIARSLRPAWGPVLAVGGVAAAAVFFLARTPAPETANIDSKVASKDATPEVTAPKADKVTHPKSPATEPAPRLAADEFGQPSSEATEIQQIEFGGMGGRISQMEGEKGTVTVIWITEEEDPADSERSL